MATQFVYSFGAGKTDGSADMRNLLGGKGANLAEMASLGLPVPLAVEHLQAAWEALARTAARA